MPASLISVVAETSRNCYYRMPYKKGCIGILSHQKEHLFLPFTAKSQTRNKTDMLGFDCNYTRLRLSSTVFKIIYKSRICKGCCRQISQYGEDCCGKAQNMYDVSHYSIPVYYL